MRGRFHRWTLAGAAALAVAAAPGGAWAQASSCAALPRASIDSLFGALAADTTGTLKGVVVLRCGDIAAERYFNGADARTLHDVRSVTKSITATLVGIAIDRGLIRGVDVPIGSVLPRGAPAWHPAIRVSDLLTMRSGLDADDQDSLSAGNEDRLDASPDWIAFARRVPAAGPPGAKYAYASLNSFLAGAAVEHASGMPLAAFAERNLFAPLGITRYSWRRGPRGEGVGQGNLSLTARDLAAIGELYRQHGRFRGRRVVDSAWVASAWSSYVPTGASGDTYGYSWYAREHTVRGAPVRVHYASGNGGNKIYVVPSAGVVVAVTSSAYGRGYGHRRSDRILADVLSAVLR